MPNTNVSLDVRNSPSNGSDGYINTTATNGAVYSYQYTGGSDTHGNTSEIVGSGSATITVTLHSDVRYQMTGILFSGDAGGDLSTQPALNTLTSIIITDIDATTGNGYYKITVTDTVANCSFDCDPTISNVPT